MSKITKTLNRVLRGNADASIRFSDLCGLLKHLGFAERVRGDHHIFSREGVVEIINLQARGSQAKAYQVKQVRGLILTYQLAETPDAELPTAEESRGQNRGQTSVEEIDDG